MAMIITLAGCNWDVQNTPDGQKVLVFTDLMPIGPGQAIPGTTVNVPLDENAARGIAAKLQGRPAVQIASGMPPPVAKQNGRG